MSIESSEGNNGLFWTQVHFINNLILIQKLEVVIY